MSFQLVCVICEARFEHVRGNVKTCSHECQVEHRRTLNREKARRNYKPRSLRPDFRCEACGAMTPQSRSGRKRFCDECRANKRDDHHRSRLVGSQRACYKCGAMVEGRTGKPGVTVCDACRSDPRKNRTDHERRRRFRRYGLTEAEYDTLFASQGERCRGCGTLEPGGKGWCIDHDHTTMQVRAILCNRCNTTIGLTDESPEILRSLADLVTEYRAEVKI